MRKLYIQNSIDCRTCWRNRCQILWKFMLVFFFFLVGQGIRIFLFFCLARSKHFTMTCNGALATSTTSLNGWIVQSIVSHIVNFVHLSLHGMIDFWSSNIINEKCRVKLILFFIRQSLLNPLMISCSQYFQYYCIYKHYKHIISTFDFKMAMLCIDLYATILLFVYKIYSCSTPCIH